MSEDLVQWCFPSGAGLWRSLQVLAGGAGAEEASDPRGSHPGAGDLGRVSGSWSAECHQRGLQELRQNHAEHQGPRPLRFPRRSGRCFPHYSAHARLSSSSPERGVFVLHQEHIYKLMKSDSYSRFIRSSAYQELLQAKKKVKPLKRLETAIWASCSNPSSLPRLFSFARVSLRFFFCSVLFCCVCFVLKWWDRKCWLAGFSVMWWVLSVSSGSQIYRHAGN